ncbi:F-box protein [Phanerochaete sordida]|uniref:F-box protein n=1 Tax=Phanerochaete sordida TaxID=48140 RepID=A0A9P3G8J7_9APHY|nr:F-box protein [Phanerochaete sordida]
MPFVPPEIISEVLAFSKQDKQTLARCSLVSRQWCQLSSPYLFNNLHLRDPPAGYPAEPFEALYAFVERNPRIRCLVRELRLTSVDSLFEVQISLERVRALIALLPFLHTIIVGSVQLREIPGEPPLTNEPPASPLQLRYAALSTSFCLGVHPTFLSRFLSHFAAIDELHFQGGVAPRALHSAYRFAPPALHELQPAPHSARPAVRVLALGRFDAAQKLLPVLPAFVRVDTLEALRVSHFTGGLVALVDALLGQTPRLRELALSFFRFASANLAYAVAQSEQYHLPGLARCPRLEALTLGVEIHLDYDLSDINQVYWRRCLEALGSACPGVRTLTLAIQTWAVTGTNYFEPLAELDWALLDRLLARFAQLTAVRVDVSSRNIGHWILAEDEMRARLSEKLSPRIRSLVRIAFADAS